MSGESEDTHVPKRLKDMPVEHVLAAGTPMCAGCGGLSAINEAYDVLGPRTVFVNAAGCMTLLAIYPFTPFRGSWLYTAMASAPAGAQGVRDALDVLKQRGRISEDDDLDVVVLTGDGSAYGMGLSATSGAIERNLDFIYLCYDNEGYGNTGQQYSGSTPHGARTATSHYGFHGKKKDLFAIWAAHDPAYVATVSPADPVDLARKLHEAKARSGPRLILAYAACPTGWDFDPQESMHVAKAAIETGIFPLKEYADGKVTHTKVPKSRKPVDEYLKLQGRFRHLFAPERNEAELAQIQANVDAYWARVEDP
jgi:pyruvate ferredoxin oxidoreductase beta subunit